MITTYTIVNGGRKSESTTCQLLVLSTIYSANVLHSDQTCTTATGLYCKAVLTFLYFPISLFPCMINTNDRRLGIIYESIPLHTLRYQLALEYRISSENVLIYRVMELLHVYTCMLHFLKNVCFESTSGE